MDLNRAIFANVLLTLAYFVCGKLVSLLSFPPIGTTPLWLPAGIAVGAVLIWGPRLLPGAFLGDLLLGLDFYGFSQGSAYLLSFGWGAQSVFLAWLALVLARKLDVWPSFMVAEKEIIKFYVIVGIAVPILPSLLAIGLQLWSGEIEQRLAAEAFLLWWVATAMGIVIMTPVMLTLFATPRSVWQSRVYNVGIPLIGLLSVLIVVLGIANERDIEVTQGRFQSNVKLSSAAIDQEVGYHETILSALQAFFNGSNAVTEDEFKMFLDDFNPHKHKSQVFGWIEYRHNPEHPTQDAYIIKYLQDYSVDSTQNLIHGMKGFDLCTLDRGGFCDGIQRKINQSNFTALLRGFLGADDKLTYLLPVERHGQNLGYILYQYSQDLFSSTARDYERQFVDFMMTDLLSGRVSYSASQHPKPLMDFLSSQLTSSRKVVFADHQWRLDFYPSATFMQEQASWSYYWIITSSLVVFILSGVWLMTMTGRYNLVEHEVNEKTKKLREHTRLLAESEKKYRSLVEGIQDEYFLYSHDKGGYFHYISPSVEKILGYSQEEFLNHYSTFMPDTELNRKVFEYTQRTLSGEKSNYEIEVFSKDGKIHTLALTETPSYDENKHIIGVEGIARDVTESRMAQLELEKLSLAVQHSPNAVIIIDKAGYIEYVNPKFTAITGYSKEDATVQWPDLINSGTNDPGIYQEIWDTIQAGEEWRGELQNRKKNGELYWAQELIAPMVNASGEVTHYVDTQVDITEARRLSEEKSYQASHDLLTGLINRREFDLRLDRVIHAAKRNMTEHALCFLDLDQFKLINDTCGHTAGDELLRQVGSLLQTNVRSRDTIARLGGDEFAILMEHCVIDQAYQACEQLLEMLRDFRFHWQEYTFTIGGSIGLTIIDHLTVNSNEALRTVDTACYAAKDAGRNRIEVHREDSERLLQRRGEIQWSTEISEALDNDRFLLFAQPIKPLLGENTNLSYEVLVRMRRRDGEISPPGAFLPAAERYNSITRIDRWVVTHTLNWIQQHAERLNQVGTISINLSGVTLGDDSMLDFIVSTIESSNIPPEKIKFEITETAAIANLQTATGFIEKLREKGILFALDDFGSGLSSFAYLKKMKVDALKIDGMFVKDMLDDPLDYEMVKSINEIGHVMGLHTIAEFVENEAILNKLREIGVDYVQGYAIGKPAPIDEILK